jgi:hypothetical protein
MTNIHKSLFLAWAVNNMFFGFIGRRIGIPAKEDGVQHGVTRPSIWETLQIIG